MARETFFLGVQLACQCPEMSQTEMSGRKVANELKKTQLQQCQRYISAVYLQLSQLKPKKLLSVGRLGERRGALFTTFFLIEYIF